MKKDLSGAVKKTTPFDFINSINLSKNNILTEETESGYVPFLVNRGLSYFIDTVMYANEMNLSSCIDKKLQYEYFLHSIRRSKRFSRWTKAENDEVINIIKEYYGFNDQKAAAAAGILSKDNIQFIKNELEKGVS
jgi:hypothetical protein